MGQSLRPFLVVVAPDNIEGAVLPEFIHDGLGVDVAAVNPGSCGRRRFNQEITLAAMTVDGRHAQAEKVTIPHEK